MSATIERRTGLELRDYYYDGGVRAAVAAAEPLRRVESLLSSKGGQT